MKRLKKWEVVIRCNGEDFAEIKSGKDFSLEFKNPTGDMVMDFKQRAKVFNSIKLFLSAHEKTYRDWLSVNDPERGKSQKVPSQNLH